MEVIEEEPPARVRREGGAGTWAGTESSREESDCSCTLKSSAVRFEKSTLSLYNSSALIICQRLQDERISTHE